MYLQEGASWVQTSLYLSMFIQVNTYMFFFPKKLSLSPPSVVNVVNPTVNLPFGDGSCHPFMCDFWGWFIVGFTTLADWWFGT